MTGAGKTVGAIMIAAGVLVALLAALFFGAGFAQGRQLAAMVLGFGLVFVAVVMPLAGVGGFLFVKGVREAATFAELAKQRKILDMVLARGQVRVAEVALELNATRDQVKDYIYDLVGKGLFTGYINWEEGVLYSKQASELREGRKCPNCGGELELVGRGVISCPYCGTDIFL
jgi:hypothetical protein